MNSLNEESKLKIWTPEGLSGFEFLSDTGASVYANHVHDAYTLDLVMAGKIDYQIGSQRVVVNQGELVWIDRCEVHGGRAIGAERLTIRSILIPEKLVSKTHGLQRESRIIFDTHLFRETSLLHLRSERSARVQQIETDLAGIISALFAVSQRGSILRNEREHKAALAVKEYLQAHFEEPISIRKLAKISHLSTPHLVRAFRREIGLPPYAYLTQLRIARARLLLSSGMSPADVAVAVGLSDQSHLTRFFKRTTGMTPGSYLHERDSFR